ncbi:Hypothetical protein D9617_50g044300 [Elsinoe fawcettii]|nr:Hypothetical protein D9617_50g044300 [Elsinoe fawcettii]
MPSHFSAARLWLSEGPLSFAMVKPEDSLQTVLVEPSALANDEESRNKNWGFVEATYTDEDGLFANLSFVDFLGMAIGMVLESADRPMQSVKGPSVVAIEEICRQLSAKAAADHQPWDGLCVYDESGRAVRVLSPNSYMALHPNAFFDYWTQYINEVWTRFEQPGKELSIDTQGQAGIVRCSVKLGVLICDGDNRSYQRPSAQDIFGCSSGPFAVLPGDNAVHDAVAPRLCAAVQRTTLLLPLGDTQPYEDYSDFYGTSPTNWYSSFVHAALSDARGYTFPYDDVAPSNGSDLAGIITSIDPEKWIITLGADSSVVSGNMTH